MNRALCLLSSIFLMLSFSTAKAAAQACFSFQSDYGVYTDESITATTIYTSVVLDGSGEMIVNNNGSPFCNVGSATHTPLTTNLLGSTGGGSQGASACPDCYLYSTNDQTIVATPGTDYTWTWSAGVDCSIAGLFFITQGSALLKIAQTSWGPPPIVQGTDDCYWTVLACSSGKPTCKDVDAWTFVPGCPKYMKQETLVVNGYCVPAASVASEATGPGSCN